MLNIDYLQARKVLLPSVEHINIVLVGCGGTGSWLAPTLARFARLLVDGLDKDVRVTFVDPDKVEEKNVYRQNFCHAEIGRNKADALAFRYGLAWGVSIAAVAAPFAHTLPLPMPADRSANALTVLVGCVDNGLARQEIEAFALASTAKSVVWWLDCGNGKAFGQVLLGRKLNSGEAPLLLDGLCSWLPLPSVQHPELLLTADMEADKRLGADEEQGLSCAELAMRGSQSLTVNTRMAALAGEMLGRLLLTGDLEYYAAYVDQASGETRKFITDAAIVACMAGKQ